MVISKVNDPYRNEIFWWNLQAAHCRWLDGHDFDLRNYFQENFCPDSFNENLWQNAWSKVEDRANELIDSNYGGTGTPSLFKRATAAAIAIVEVAPLPSTMATILPEQGFPNRFLSYPNSLRASAAYHFARLTLKNLTINNHRSEQICLKKIIQPSLHFENDLRYALAQIAFKRPEKPSLDDAGTARGIHTFNGLTLLFESLAYESNGGFEKLGLL